MKKNKIQLVIILILVTLNFCIVENVVSGGISVDAGLTPAANRWIFKTQVRFMKRDNHPVLIANEMKMRMHPIVVAYGLKSNIAIMLRQAVMHKEMTMMNQTNSSSGLGDLFVMAKYRLVRINDPKYTLGIAPTFGIEFPTGASQFTSDSYDFRFGGYLSARARRLAMDLNLSYLLNGSSTTSGIEFEEGNEFSLVSAIAYQISIGSGADFSFTPVVESAYQKIYKNSQNGIDNYNSGESLFLLSPGFKVTYSSYIFESLLQIPVWQEQNGLQTERATTLLIGIRIMN